MPTFLRQNVNNFHNEIQIGYKTAAIQSQIFFSNFKNKSLRRSRASKTVS